MRKGIIRPRRAEGPCCCCRHSLRWLDRHHRPQPEVDLRSHPLLLQPSQPLQLRRRLVRTSPDGSGPWESHENISAANARAESALPGLRKAIRAESRTWTRQCFSTRWAGGGYLLVSLDSPKTSASSKIGSRLFRH